jgi:hypothetical protein
MACNYTFAGQLLDCKEVSGGIKEIYIVDRSMVSAYTIDGATKKILTVTMTASNKFKTYQLRKQVASMTTTATSSDTAGTTFFSTDVTFSIPKMAAAKRLEFLAMSVGNMAVIVRDNNNVYWGLGFDNPVVLTSGSGVTGTNFGDANQYSYTLNDTNAVAPYEMTQSILTGIIDANISYPLPA